MPGRELMEMQEDPAPEVEGVLPMDHVFREVPCRLQFFDPVGGKCAVLVAGKRLEMPVNLYEDLLRPLSADGQRERAEEETKRSIAHRRGVERGPSLEEIADGLRALDQEKSREKIRARLKSRVGDGGPVIEDVAEVLDRRATEREAQQEEQ